MKNEVLPVGTESLLRGLGYVLDTSRERWLCGGEGLKRPLGPPLDYEDRQLLSEMRAREIELRMAPPIRTENLSFGVVPVAAAPRSGFWDWIRRG